MDQSKVDIEAIVQAVLTELRKQGSSPQTGGSSQTAAAAKPGELVIDLPDPTLPEARHKIGVKKPYDLEGLRNLCSTTTARIGVGRAGSRPRTSSMLLFQADHGVTQDAIYGVVSEETLKQFGLFTVQTQIKDRGEYL
ncbi:MAG: ethanolamine ammonia-lyase light chain EutC, partial [Anaerolineaceae bacterium]|nr:ethanolamine ammonia-lyase light chain EutC [Anaerolineaceae bacterium]